MDFITMGFETRGALKRILSGITENKIMPRYSQHGHISHFIFSLGGDMDIEFTYHNTEEEGCVLLNFGNTTFNFCIEVGLYRNAEIPFVASDMITQKEIYDFVMHYKNLELTDSADEIDLLKRMYSHATFYLKSTSRTMHYKDNPALMQEDEDTMKRYKSYIKQRRKELGEFELTRSALREMGKTTENTDGEND